MADRRTVALTPRGAVLAVLAAALGAGAWAGGVLEFAVVGGALAFGLLGAAVLVLVRAAGLRRATFELALPPDEVVAGSAVSVGVVLRDVAKWSTGDLCVDDPTGRWDVRRPTSDPAGTAARPVASHLPPTRMRITSVVPLRRQRTRATWAAWFPFPAGTRGLVRLAPLHLWCTDPLRLVARQVGTTPTVHRLVVPRPLAVSLPRVPVGPEGVEGAEDLGDLRPYVPGDRLTHLHWPSLARGGEPLVRRLVDEGTRHLRLLLDFKDPAAREQVIGAAAGLGTDAARHGAAVDLWTTTGQHWSVASGSGAPGALLRLLATVGPEDRLGPGVESQRPPDGVVAVTTPARRDHLVGTVRTASVVLVAADRSSGAGTVTLPSSRAGDGS